MSFAAQTWARKLRIGGKGAGIAKAVLRHLADVADGGGYSHYGFEALCREVEFTPRAVAKAVSLLIARGLLEKRDRRSRGEKGKWLAPEWRVLIPRTAPADSHPLGESISPCESAPTDPVSPCENDSSAPANSQGNPTRESNKEESRSLREREPAAAPPLADSDAGLDLRKQVFTEGCAIVQRRTGRMNGQARGLIGRFLNDARGDAAIVLGVLHDADADPPGDFVSWVVAAIQQRQGRRGGKSVIDQIREDWGLTTLIAPDVFDDSVPNPDPAKAIAWEGVAP